MARVSQQASQLQRMSQKQQELQWQRGGGPKREAVLTWGPIDELYRALGEQLVKFATEFSAQYQQVTLSGGGTARGQQLVNTALNDCDAFGKQLRAIYDKHSSYSGDVLTRDAMTVYYNVMAEYDDLYRRLQGQVYSYATEMTTILHALGATLKQSGEQTSEVTDVVVKH